MIIHWWKWKWFGLMCEVRWMQENGNIFSKSDLKRCELFYCLLIVDDGSQNITSGCECLCQTAERDLGKSNIWRIFSFVQGKGGDENVINVWNGVKRAYAVSDPWEKTTTWHIPSALKCCSANDSWYQHLHQIACGKVERIFHPYNCVVEISFDL